MKIEVSCKANSSKKDKGDLLEGLAKKLLEAQGFEVVEEIRIVGAELDLLCKHKVNRKEIYVECKAQKDPISAPILRQLWGTVDCEDYSEGWLISTSDFTKDAKGFIDSWKKKPKSKSERLSFYDPKTVIDALISASIVKTPPVSNAENIVGSSELLGEWTLLTTEYGLFWCVYTLKGGTPFGVLVFNATNGSLIQDEDTIQNLSDLDSTLADYDLTVGINKTSTKDESSLDKLPTVVEVQIGESWDDYRPARPKDFVGRDSTQKEILNFLNAAKALNGSRIFAITGNSGLGKSSLIAKLRDRSKNKHYRKKYFVYAVDIRGAREPSYIPASLIKCLREAQKNDFGDKFDLNLTDPSSPLNSESIKKYLDSLAASEQIICLIFDQFEELYSKPELFGIFKAAKDLMLDVAGTKANFVLGFAWKTDSTTQQDHPAYHMWHELSDHRREYRLDVFDNGEISKSLTKFEKEVGQKITAETRHQISQSCQGFPWLLKKLCINLYEGISKGESSETLLVDLDIGRLFDADLEVLTQQELVCLKLIAQKAPADWSEIIETSGTTVLNNLVSKRLVVKSGDRLNVYWDIFKDYLLTGKVPVVPYNYIPSTDPSSVINICNSLNTDTFLDSGLISQQLGLNEKTVWNIGADIVMLGLAERKGTSFKLRNKIAPKDEVSVLKALRRMMSKHSLKLSIFKNYSGKTISQETINETLKNCLPKASFGEKTWKTYTNRLINYLIYTGFLLRAGHNLIVQDTGSVIADREDLARRGRQRGKVFSVPVSPHVVLEALESIDNLGIDITEIPRNALSVLRRFELVSLNEQTVTPNMDSITKSGGPKESIWAAAKNERSLIRCKEILTDNPEIETTELAAKIADEYKLNWSDASRERNGRILKQWSQWIKEGIELSYIPTPPGRITKALQSC